MTCLAVIPLVYLISFLFSNALTAYAILVLILFFGSQVSRFKSHTHAHTYTHMTSVYTCTCTHMYGVGVAGHCHVCDN